MNDAEVDERKRQLRIRRMIHGEERETRLNKDAADERSLPRVAQVVETLTMGGAENLAVRIANGLAARGYEAHLVVVTGPGVLSDRVDSAVKLHYLGFERSSIRNPFAFVRSLFDGRRRLGGLLSKLNVHVAQTHLPGANFLGLLLTYGTGMRVVPTVHNNREFDYGDKDNPLLLRLRKWAYGAMISRCAGMVAVSRAVKASLEAELGTSPVEAERIHVVTNGVSLPDPLPEHEVREIRARYGIADGTVFALSAGRLSEQKNFADLVRVAALLRDRGCTVHFVVAGEGPLHDELETAISTVGLGSVVTLAGNVVDLERVMGAADVFVTTSLWEGLPLVLLEAMACGLPSVGFAIDGVVEILSDGVQGRVVPAGDVVSMTDALETVLTNADLRTAYGNASRELVGNTYNFETLLDRLADVYAAVVGDGVEGS